VGQVAREVEAAGIVTAVLSWIPELSVAVGAPRVVGIGYPGSVPFGRPGEADGQRSVLRGALEAACAMVTPGERVDLNHEWPPNARVPGPPRPPPIASAIKARPWLLLRLLRGDLPQ
jgi:hypothetical protein